MEFGELKFGELKLGEIELVEADLGKVEFGKVCHDVFEGLACHPLVSCQDTLEWLPCQDTLDAFIPARFPPVNNTSYGLPISSAVPEREKSAMEARRGLLGLALMRVPGFGGAARGSFRGIGGVYTLLFAGFGEIVS